MVGEKVRVAFVGGGRTAQSLLEAFLGLPYIDVVGLADRDPDARAAVIAREKGVYYATDALSLIANVPNIDLLIEVTGDPSVKPALKEVFVAEGNRHTIILQDLVARVLLSMLLGTDHLIEPHHPDDRGIG